jgi:hypothetical protein
MFLTNKVFCTTTTTKNKGRTEIEKQETIRQIGERNEKEKIEDKEADTKCHDQTKRQGGRLGK